MQTQFVYSFGIALILVFFIRIHDELSGDKLPIPGMAVSEHVPAGYEFTPPPASVNEEQPLAIVRRFRPLVRVREAENPQWIEASLAKELFDRDTLRTDDQGYAVVQLIDNSLARVRPNSMLIIRGEVNNRSGINSSLNLESGSVNLSVSGRNSEYEVRTPSSTASVKGTRFQSTVNDDGSSTFVCFSGNVVITASKSGNQVQLTRRRQAKVDPQGDHIEVTTLSNRQIRQMEREEEEIEKSATPKRIIIRLRNADGQIREFEIPYYEQNGN